MPKPLALALVVALVVVFTPRPALAQQGDSGLQLAGEAMVAVTVAPVAFLGIATDLIVGAELANTGHARLVWSITGTVTWSLVSLGVASLFYGTGARASASLNEPATYLVSAFCLGSLAWSIYGITRHPPAVTVSPAALATPRGGLAPGLVVAGRW